MVALDACAFALRLPPTPYDAQRLIIVRHGSVARNLCDPPIAEGALCGGLEVPLSEQGKAEAAAAAETLAAFAQDNPPAAVQYIASSPVEHAVYGADQIVEAVQPHSIGRLSTATYGGLREIDQGEWVNKTRTQIVAQWGDDAFERAAGEDDYGSTHGGESIGELRERVLTTRDYILKKVRPGSAAVIVSHLWVTRTILADALGDAESPVDLLSLDVPAASISVIDYTAESWPPALATSLPDVLSVGGVARDEDEAP